MADLEILDDVPEGEGESLADDAHFLGDDDEIQTRQKLNSVATITSLRFQPITSSRFSIPWCRLLAMPMVRPTLASDLAKLEQEFVHGYREGASVFYVTTTNEDGNSHEVIEADKASRVLFGTPKTTFLIRFSFPIHIWPASQI